MKSKQILAASAILTVAAVTWAVAAMPAQALECSVLPSNICDQAEKDAAFEGSSVWMLLVMAINILAAGVGVVAVGAIAYAGFLYSTAQGSAEQTKKALEIIRNAAIGLLLFAGMFAIVNFLVPGGLFGGSGGGAGSNPPRTPPACGPGTGRVCPE